MNLKELQAVAEENPESLEYIVISSADNEGNSFSTVHSTGSIGIFNKDEFEFYQCVEDFEESGYDESDINAICIN